MKRIIFGFLTLVIVGLLCLAYAYFIEPHRLVVNHTDLKVKNWNPAFDGLKIVMIGDIHGGSNAVDEEMLRRVVARANEQDADLIVLLGDYVSERKSIYPISEEDLKMPMARVADGLAGLHARYGVVAVLGNHDGWYCDSCVRRELTRVGYTVLENEVTVIEKDSQKLRILGLRDHMKIRHWVDFSNAVKSDLAATDHQGDVVVLEHSPDILPIITGDLSISADLKLILAAHTHGGQVWLPIFGTPIVPSTFGQKYSYGHVKENGVDMFVTSGVGTSVLPIRFMMPPEIAVLTIRSE